MNYEKIYQDCYSKYYDKAELFAKGLLQKGKSQKKTIGTAINEASYYFENDYIKSHNIDKNESLVNLQTLFCKRHSIYEVDEVQEIFENNIKPEFDKIKLSVFPINYTFSKLIMEIAIIEVEREISRLLSQNSRLLEMFYKLNEFDEFELRYHKGLSLEDYPIFKKLHRKFYPEDYTNFKENEDLTVIKYGIMDLSDATSKGKNYLGTPMNEKGNELFEYLIENYRPDEKTSVKFVNLLHYLKYDANKELYIFNLKQMEYKEMIENKIGISISQFRKSERYNEVEKPILNSLESGFGRK